MDDSRHEPGASRADRGDRSPRFETLMDAAADAEERVVTTMTPLFAPAGIPDVELDAIVALGQYARVADRLLVLGAVGSDGELDAARYVLTRLHRLRDEVARAISQHATWGLDGGA